MFWLFISLFALIAIVYIYLMYRLLLKVKRSKRLTFLKIQLVFTFFLVVIVAAVAYSNREFLLSLSQKGADDAVVSPSRRTGGTVNACNCTWDSMNLKRDDYAEKHRPAAEALSAGSFIRDEAAMNQLLSKGNLVPVKSGSGIRIDKLSHSHPFLHPRAKTTFTELSRRFRERLGEREQDAEIVISSVTRTATQQEEVRKRYPFGATPGTSTHSYGVSVDILKVETTGNCYNARKALEITLREMQSEGMLLICPESKCIHLTAL